MQISTFNLKMNDELASLKQNLLPTYRSGDVEGLFEYFDEKGLVSTLNVDCPEFEYNIELDMGNEDPHATDGENVKRLYEGLKSLPPSIAAKPDFWGAHVHSYMYDYVIYRSETERKNYDERSVLRDFFCRSRKERPQRMLVVNLLSRLWWTGRLIYDDKNEDPYHFVDLLTKSAYNSKIVLLASSTASSNHEIFMGLLDAVEQFKVEHQLADVTRGYFVPCTKHLNSIGGVRMIDTLSRGEIKDICLDVLNHESGEDGADNNDKE